MFDFLDYYNIISDHFEKKPENDKDFIVSSQMFSIDIGGMLGQDKKENPTKSDKLKWLKILNTHRRIWAHKGSRNKGLNKEQVEFIEFIFKKLGI